MTAAIPDLRQVAFVRQRDGQFWAYLAHGQTLWLVPPCPATLMPHVSMVPADRRLIELASALVYYFADELQVVPALVRTFLPNLRVLLGANAENDSFRIRSDRLHQLMFMIDDPAHGGESLETAGEIACALHDAYTDMIDDPIAHGWADLDAEAIDVATEELAESLGTEPYFEDRIDVSTDVRAVYAGWATPAGADADDLDDLDTPDYDEWAAILEIMAEAEEDWNEIWREWSDNYPV